MLKKIDGINVPSPPVVKSPLYAREAEAIKKGQQALLLRDSPQNRKEIQAQAPSETLETLEALTTMYDKDIDLSEGKL